MRQAPCRVTGPADSQSYLALLQLHTPPSSSKTGSAFSYADTESSQYHDMPQLLSRWREELLLDVGDEDIDKSALREKCPERVEEHGRLCRLDGKQGIDRDTLFAHIAGCFAVEQGKRIRVLLFTARAIEERLRSPRFAEIHKPRGSQLKPLQEAESSACLRHRMQPGCSGASPFSIAAVKPRHRPDTRRTGATQSACPFHAT